MSWKALDENHKQKRHNNKRAAAATYGFYLEFINTFVGKCNGTQREGGYVVRRM